MSDIDTYKTELEQMVQQAEKERLEQEIKENTITKVSLDDRLKVLERKIDYIFNIIKGVK